VADVAAYALGGHDRRHAAERWSTKRREHLSVEFGLVVSHLGSALRFAEPARKRSAIDSGLAIHV
jgi:hypothetical protein